MSLPELNAHLVECLKEDFIENENKEIPNLLGKAVELIHAPSYPVENRFGVAQEWDDQKKYFKIYMFGEENRVKFKKPNELKYFPIAQTKKEFYLYELSGNEVAINFEDIVELFVLFAQR